MKVLVVGSGGREHALCRALKRSARLSALFCAPGNAGIAGIAECVAIGAEDVDALSAWARDNAVDLVVVGPEAPLVLGLADMLSDAGVRVFGPSAAAAALEGSKGFMKDVLRAAGAPTAAYGRFADPGAAKAFIAKTGAPVVVKADGLAAGKGVIVCPSEAEALKAVDDMMIARVFGDAGAEIVVEEFLTGEEVSFFALCDGDGAAPLIAAQDHKAVGEGGVGPNTGGMGAYSPVPVFTAALRDEVMRTCVQPTIERMKAIGRPYKGVLFCGLMICEDGPKVLEYNVRFGDPECQAVLARLDGDLLQALDAAASGRVAQARLAWKEETALAVVMAAKGYPGPYRTGTAIRNLAAAEALTGVAVLHAGTRAEGGGIVACGGRALSVVALGASVNEARARAYRAVKVIDWEDGFWRRDIGWRAGGS